MHPLSEIEFKKQNFAKTSGKTSAKLHNHLWYKNKLFSSLINFHDPFECPLPKTKRFEKVPNPITKRKVYALFAWLFIKTENWIVEIIFKVLFENILKLSERKISLQNFLYKNEFELDILINLNEKFFLLLQNSVKSMKLIKSFWKHLIWN